MPPRTRRSEALTRQRIVDAAIELLDTTGDAGLTFRTLTERLATGPGAIYWHVANKGELLAAATEALVTAALPADLPGGIHGVALGLFDAISAHPWLATQLATQLSRSPSKSVTPLIFEAIGREVRALDVPDGDQFIAASALLHYILGAAGQNAANARVAGSGTERAEFLNSVSKAWEQLDPDDYPFTRAVAAQMREHDDREQFLAGIDLILAGITARER
ncbi:regulatory protein, tetR family [Amycolatopsis xylanica]|uniref:Regulatory protein, tetR family n=1 Tax=Amycolatopsis xylanica TaxID=589385 RepID=A0A1H2VFJ8_9PSEU|nr:TetR/AcrR family transcriptional regulator [Amycolatopsis xylanica]SDW67062.1 regulatory protein, tetR family [Amycolatopsis xylanica]